MPSVDLIMITYTQYNDLIIHLQYDYLKKIPEET